MSSLALNKCVGSLSGFGSLPAGDTGQNVLRKTWNAVSDLRAGAPARTSWAFNDLHALAREHDTEVQQSEVLMLAQRFLLALPGAVPAPELSFDDDGEVSFDWKGREGELLTITLREDGRLSYAARLSAYNREHGTKKFVDAIPRTLVELVHEVTGT